MRITTKRNPAGNVRRLRALLFLALAGTLPAATIGNNLVSRPGIDTCGTCYFVLNVAPDPGESILTWSFFGDHSTNLKITPFLVDVSTDLITGVGTTQTASTNLQGPFNFGLVSGSALIGANTRFGWRDGTTSAGNAGSIDFDTTSGGPNTGTAGFWGFLNSAPASFTTGTSLGAPENANTGRYYSVQISTGIPITNTPEPSTGLLAGSILAGLAAWRIRLNRGC
jgi:hypothetical protein